MALWLSMMLMLRPLALMMPAVTVDVRLNGFPTAMTHSPKRSKSELPKARGCRLSALILSTAKSVVGSVPTTSATYSRLSLSDTLTSLALSITWLLVTMYPSLEITTPDPLPCTILGVICGACSPKPKKKSRNGLK